MAAELHDEARALIARLRTPRVTHHQVSDDWEPYKTVAKTHALDPVRVEAADMIERLLAALGVKACPSCLTKEPPIPFDHKGLPMTRCPKCGIEVNADGVSPCRGGERCDK